MLEPAVLRSSLAAVVLCALAASTAAAQAAPTLAPGVEPAAQSDAMPELGPVNRQFVVTANGPALPGGGVLSTRSDRGPIAPSRFAGALPFDYGTGLRRTLLMGLTGAAAGAVAGMAMEIVDPHGEIADVWPVLLAIPGFFGGVVYSLVLSNPPE